VEIFSLFILGLFIGSFLNVLIDRIPQDESIVKGRSYCDKCKKKLKWHDLIPVLSFLILNGKCRYCHSSISIFYPVVELTTAISFVLTYFYLFNLSDSRFAVYDLQFFAMVFYYLVIVSSMIVVFFADLKYGIIPDKVIFPAIAFSFLYLILNHEYLIPNTVSGLLAFLFFLILYLATGGRGMGFGDVKLVFWLGLFLGFPRIIPALYLSFLLGAVTGLILVISKKKRLFKGETIPFGPFLVSGSIISLFFGERLINLFIMHFLP